MGLFDGMKGRLGFGDKPEWQDDGYYDDQSPDDGYASYEEDDYVSSTGDVVSFEAYNPNTFKNISFDSERTPRVATRSEAASAGGYSSIGRTRAASSARSSRSQDTSGRSSASSRLYDGEADAGGSWTAPSDPSFLDAKPAGKSRDVLESIGATKSQPNASDPYSQFDSDMKQVHRDTGSRLEVVMPKVYSDVEKIATAAKAGKSVVLVLDSTKQELAKRILDFSFGVASALNKNVEKASGKVFIISKGAEMLTADERSYLVKKGILK